MSDPAAQQGYFEHSRTPIHSLILVAPFLLVYEVGVIALQLGTPEFNSRNGVDVVFYDLAARMGMSILFVGVLVLGASWMVWQLREKASLRFDVKVVALMFVESALLGLFLFTVPWQIASYLFGYFQQAAGPGAMGPVAASAAASSGFWGNLVLSCGAGVYEEFLFRVLLVSSVALVCRRFFELQRFRAGIVAVLVGALLFSAAHYAGEHGDPVSLVSALFWSGFIFRFVAGVFFAAIYYYRCFGVAVAAHAIYDILVSVDHVLRT